jgi:peptidoglycan/LPS O-acetylase OafA/YrhL
MGRPPLPGDGRGMSHMALPDAVPAPDAPGRPEPATGRDELIDVVRAGSLVVVVAYHWLFTVVRWFDDGPHASNPIGSTRGLWLLTWVLQVMPLFFVVGGAVHAKSSDRGRTFVVRRLQRLVPPAAVLVGVVGGLGWIAGHAGVAWAPQAALLVLSPLWFLAVYALLVLLTPLARWAHGRWGEVVPVALLVAVALIDLLRFRFEVTWVGWLSWIAVFGFCHQVGFSWDRLRAASSRTVDCLLVGGLGAMVVLTNLGPYPRSTVGVPGEAISNMGPPTVVIAALCCLQVGLLLKVAPRLLAVATGRGRRVVTLLQRRSMALYLLHGPAVAIAYAAVTVVAGRPPETPDVAWWLSRPVWLLVPGAVCAGLFAAGRVLLPSASPSEVVPTMSGCSPTVPDGACPSAPPPSSVVDSAPSPPSWSSASSPSPASTSG